MRRSDHPKDGYPTPPRWTSITAMNPMVLEACLIVLAAICFWLLDRYVIGCERI
jgi:hypothetical protein